MTSAEYIVYIGSIDESPFSVLASMAKLSRDATVRERIVRCRDCRFRCYDECTRIDEGFKGYWFAIEPDDFCSYGERRDDDR